MESKSARKTKVLFFAEGATLAHVARPFVLANTLDLNDFDVTFARPSSFGWLTANAAFRTMDLECQDSAVFAQRVERGRPVYAYKTLVGYVGSDLALIDAEKPDVVVGDFRLSLTVSARLRSVPYINICDAYWSPERPLRAPLPVLPFTRFTPIPVAEFLFRWLSPPIKWLYAAPVERLRARYGMSSLGYNAQRGFTDGDLRLYANFPELFPDVTLSAHSAFIGPIAWSPPATGNLDFLEGKEGLIYVTMGSSGDPSVLSNLIPLLERAGHAVVVATAGRSMPVALRPGTTRFFDYLPADLVCKKARLVVCNGGSPTTNQALRNGVPVLGIAKNMDQFLNMRAIERFGAGVLVRTDRTRGETLASTVDALLNDARFSKKPQPSESSTEAEVGSARRPRVLACTMC